MENRFFTEQQKTAIYQAANGKCKKCGISLPKVWHAHHIIQWSDGGKTDVLNGMALCKKCHEYITANTKEIELFEWQLNAHLFIATSPKRDLVIQAPTGSGKTFFGKYEISKWLQNEIDKTNTIGLILANRTNIVEQWKDKDDDKMGLRIASPTNSHLARKEVRPEMNVVAITYQQLCASKGESARLFFENKKVFVICDELHALADGKSFFSALQVAVPNPVKRIGLTATPIRSDGYQIPLMDYVVDEDTGEIVGKPDHIYSLGQAVDDGILRFPKAIFHEGTMQWYSNYEKEIQATFADELNDVQTRERLRTAIDPFKPYVNDYFKRLHEHMIEERKDGYPAKCLQFCYSIEEAYQLSIIFKKATGYNESVLVTSNDDNANDKIKDWKSNKDSIYMFVVGMATVGFNCPEVTTVSILTRITFQGWIMQVMGRAMRKPRGGPDYATLFAPNDPRFVMAYTKWRDEIASVMKQRNEEEQKEKGEITKSSYVSLMAEIGLAIRLPGNKNQINENPTISKLREMIIANATESEIMDFININFLTNKKNNSESHWDATCKEKQKILTDGISKSVRRAMYKYKRENAKKEISNLYYSKAHKVLCHMVNAISIPSASQEQLDGMIKLLNNGYSNALRNTDPEEYTYEHIGELGHN